MTHRILLVVLLVFALAACGGSPTQQAADALRATARAPGASGDTGVKPTASAPGAKTEAPSAVPAATAAAEPSAIPKAAPLKVSDKGFGQNKQEVAYAFLVDNPNQGLAVERSKYQVAAYDKAGTVLKADSSYVELLLPGQKLGVAGTMFVGEGQVVDHVDVQLTPGKAVPSDALPSFTIDGAVAFHDDEYFPKATAIIKSPYQKDINQVLVSAVAYDDSGAITGGGFTYVDFVPAGGQAPVEVSLTTTHKPAKIDLYAGVSGLSALMADTTAAPEAKPLTLVTKGYGQDKNEVGYGFVVENANAKLAVERSQYQIAAYDQAGTVLKTDSGYISLLLPGQKLGMAGTLSVPAGTLVDRFDVQVKPGEFKESDALPTFTTDHLVYQAGDYSAKVLGVITSPYQQDVDEVHVAAIAYDDKGAIIGGGFTFVSFVPANGQAAAEVSVTTAGRPTKVELHPTVSGLSSFGSASAAPKGAAAPTIVAKGYAQTKDDVGFGFVVENPSAAHAIARTRYQVAAYDEAGNVLKTDAGYLDLLLPKQKLGMGGSLSLPEGATAARVDVQIKAGEYESTESLAAFTTENVAFVEDTFSSKVTGIVKSPYPKDVKSVRVTAVAYDKAGAIVGGGFSYVDLVPAHGQAAAEVSVTVPGKPAKIELYAALSSLSDLEK